MVTDTSKSLRFQKTQMFSQTIDQKEHKNNRYKLEPATWCYKHHSIGQSLKSANLNLNQLNDMCRIGVSNTLDFEHIWQKLGRTGKTL